MSGDYSISNKLTDSKLTTFALGQVKKSRFQRDREEKELKRKQDDKEAAKVFESFVESFQGNEDTIPNEGKGMKTFVKSSNSSWTRDNEDNPHENEGVSMQLPSSSSKKPRKLSEMDMFLEELQTKEEKKRVQPVATGGKKLRQMDELFDEIKSKHETHNFKSQIAPSLQNSSVESKGSFDTGDPTTTNLFVGNLNPQTTEEHLSQVFGRYGEITSVKIMWPRTEDERGRGRNTGFVSFYKRRDADRALTELKESILDGHIIQVGWGKAVKSTFPAAAPTSLPSNSVQTTNLSKNNASTRNDQTAHISTNSNDFLDASSTLPVVASAPAPSMHMENSTVASQVIQIELPKDPRRRSIIDLLASYVAADGDVFETAIKQRELHNPDFSFLFETPPYYSTEALYYRWRVLACVNGDTHTLTSNSTGPGSAYTFSYWQTDSRYNYQPLIHGCVFVPPALPKGSVVPRDYQHPLSQRTNTDNQSHPRKKRSYSQAETNGDDEQLSDHSDKDDSRPSKRFQSNPDSDDEKPVSSTSRRHENKRTDDQGMKTGAQLQRAKEARRHKDQHRLTSREYAEWKDYLQQLTVSRAQIAQCMAFAFDQVECCEDVLHTMRIKLLPDLVIESPNEDDIDVEDVCFVSIKHLLCGDVKEFYGSALAQNTDTGVALTATDNILAGKKEDSVSVSNRNPHHPSVLVATVFLISDMLHNSASPLRHASHYLRHLEIQLPQIFQNLGWVLREGNIGRMTAAQMKDRVLRVIMTWAEWSVFPSLYLEGLRTFFLLNLNTSSAPSLATMYDTIFSPNSSQPGSNSTINNSSFSLADETLFLRQVTLREYVRLHKARSSAQETERGNDMERKDAGSDPSEWWTLEKESVRKQAKLHGVCYVTGRIEEDEETLFIAFVLAKIALVAEKHRSMQVSGVASEAEVPEMVSVSRLSEVIAAPQEGDIDGEPIIGDIDGEPMDDDIDGEPMNEDIDGTEIAVEDIDGVPMNEDYPGNDANCESAAGNAARLTETEEEEDIDGIPI